MNQPVATAPVPVTPVVLVEAATPPMAETAVSAAVTEVVPRVPSKREAALNDFLDDEDDAPVAALEDAEAEADADSDTIEVLEDLEAGGEPTDEDENADLSALETIGSVDVSDDETSEIAKVFVCKKKCLECSHLVPWAEKAYKNCHFSNGNQNCPAGSMQIQILIPFDQIVPRFLAAEEAGDTDRLIRLYEKLKLKPSYVQDAVHAKIKEERERRTARAVS